jgi:hypothetical protein
MNKNDKNITYLPLNANNDPYIQSGLLKSSNIRNKSDLGQ